MLHTSRPFAILAGIRCRRLVRVIGFSAASYWRQCSCARLSSSGHIASTQVAHCILGLHATLTSMTADTERRNSARDVRPQKFVAWRYCLGAQVLYSFEYIRMKCSSGNDILYRAHLWKPHANNLQHDTSPLKRLIVHVTLCRLADGTCRPG